MKLDKESCEHLRWTHLEQAQHCTDLPRQVTFPAHTEQGKMSQGWDKRYRSSREGEERGDEERQEKGRRNEKVKTGDRF